MAGGFLGLQRALGASSEGGARLCRGYGDLVQDEGGILELPEGFSYRVISRRGLKMSDGFQVPGAPDGMAAFSGEEGRVILVRNHELGLGSSARGALPNAKSYPEGVPCYDEGAEGELVYQGGTTHLIYNRRRGRWRRSFSVWWGRTEIVRGGRRLGGLGLAVRSLTS